MSLPTAITLAVLCAVALAALLTWGSWGASVRSERRRRKRGLKRFDELKAQARLDAQRIHVVCLDCGNVASDEGIALRRDWRRFNPGCWRCVPCWHAFLGREMPRVYFGTNVAIVDGNEMPFIEAAKIVRFKSRRA